MSFLHLTEADAEVLERPGKRSAQIVPRKNAPSARVTVTTVVMQPGAVSPRHRHEAAEQTWLVERGRARLLTSDGPAQVLAAGDVLVTPPGEVHGVEALGDEPLVYLTGGRGVRPLSRHVSSGCRARGQVSGRFGGAVV